MQKLSVYLESTDRWIQQEGIVKICDVIKSSNNFECSELDQLCDLLTSVDSFLCRCSVEALVALTEDGIVPLRKTVDVLQASVAPNSCCDSLLWGLTEAVRMTLTSSGSVTSSVAWAGHPHLVAMRAAPQYWRSVAQQLQRLTMTTHKSQYWPNVLQYCTSFLNSCFKSVPPEVSARDLRVNIANTFCRAAGATHSAEPLIHLLHAISSVQVDSAWSVDLELICDNLLNWAEQEEDQSALSAFTLMLVHCLHLQSNSDRVISTSLSDRLCQLFDAGMGGDLELVLLSHVLYRSTALSLRHGPLVAAVSSLVSSGRCSPCVAALLAPPLLRAISTLPTLSSSLSPLLRAALQCRRGASTVASSPLRHAVCSVHPSGAEADLLLKTFAAYVDADLQQQAWLSHVSYLVERGGSLSQLCWRGVCALLICPAVSSSLRSSALSLSAAHVQSCPARAADLYHCLLHRLGFETDTAATLQLLRAVPQLAVCKTLVPRLVGLLTSLCEHDRLAVNGVRLMGALWRAEPRCLPYLSTVIRVSDGSRTSLSHLPKYSLLAKLSVIADICQHSGQVGVDHVSVLSAVLSQLTTVQYDGVCALALRAIGSLCAARLLDIRSVWTILASSLRRERRPLVLKQFMEFLSLVPLLHVGSSEYETFTADILPIIWQQTSSASSSVIRAALRALGGFRPGLFALSMLPGAVKQDLEIPKSLISTPADLQKSAEELMSYVPGECYIHLLVQLPSDTLDGYGDMLCGLVKYEVQLIARHVYYSAKQSKKTGGEPTDFSYLGPSSILQALVVHLRSVTAATVDDVTDRWRQELECCIRPFTVDYGRPLPPIDLSFFCSFIDRGGRIAELCVEALSVQCGEHESALNAVKNLTSSCCAENCQRQVCACLFDHLHLLGRSVPPNLLQPFLHCHLAAWMSTASSASRCLLSIRTALTETRLHDSNRTLLSQTIESMLLKPEHYQAETLRCMIECAGELPSTSVERLSCPSLWWSVEEAQLSTAAALRSHMASSVDRQQPMVWMNEIIDTAITAGLYSAVEETVQRTLMNSRHHSSNPVWLAELMARIRSLYQQQDQQDHQQQQTLYCLVDVLVCTVVVWSPLAEWLPVCQLSRLDKSQLSQLFPAALQLLLDTPDWSCRRTQVQDFLQRGRNCPAISEKLLARTPPVTLLEQNCV